MKACLRPFQCVGVCVFFSPTLRMCVCVRESVHPYQSIQSPRQPTSREVLRQLNQQSNQQITPRSFLHLLLFIWFSSLPHTFQFSKPQAKLNNKIWTALQSHIVGCEQTHGYREYRKAHHLSASAIHTSTEHAQRPVKVNAIGANLSTQNIPFMTSSAIYFSPNPRIPNRLLPFPLILCSFNDLVDYSHSSELYNLLTQINEKL